MFSCLALNVIYTTKSSSSMIPILNTMPGPQMNTIWWVKPSVFFSCQEHIQSVVAGVDFIPWGRCYDFPHYPTRLMAARIFHGVLLNITQHELIFHFNCSSGKHKWRCWVGNIRGALDRGCFDFECRGSQENMYSSETVSVCFLIHSFHYTRHGVILINAFVVKIMMNGTFCPFRPFLTVTRSKQIYFILLWMYFLQVVWCNDDPFVQQLSILDMPRKEEKYYFLKLRFLFFCKRYHYFIFKPNRNDYKNNSIPTFLLFANVKFWKTKFYVKQNFI